jgi:hypothetical protein
MRAAVSGATVTQHSPRLAASLEPGTGLYCGSVSKQFLTYTASRGLRRSHIFLLSAHHYRQQIRFQGAQCSLSREISLRKNLGRWPAMAVQVFWYSARHVAILFVINTERSGRIWGKHRRPGLELYANNLGGTKLKRNCEI